MNISGKAKKQNGIDIWRCFEAIHAGLDLGSRILSKGIYRQALALQ